MKYTWFDEYCLSKTGAEKDYKTEWQSFRYLIRDKMFVMHTHDKEGKEILSLKLEPSHGKLLREQYEGDIVPGYYMNKEHWNSVYVDGNVPDDCLRDMVDRSYELILGGFSKKAHQEILGGA